MQFGTTVKQGATPNDDGVTWSLEGEGDAQITWSVTGNTQDTTTIESSDGVLTVRVKVRKLFLPQ